MKENGERVNGSKRRMEKKVIVTGGSGYLGSHVKMYFSADDLSRRASLDVCNAADARAIADYDVVIHMAALVDKRPESAQKVFRTNVGGAINLLENLREGQIFIFCSTKDVYGCNADRYEAVPESCSTDYCGQGAYEWSKLIAEKYVQFYAARAKARACVFRLSTVYAPASDDNPGGFVSFFARAIKEGKPLNLKMRGAQIRDLLHVDDLSRAFEAFASSDLKSGCYNIGGGLMNKLTLLELAQRLGRLAGREPNIIMSDEEVREQINYVTDISAIERDLGWTPRIDIDEGLRTLI